MYNILFDSDVLKTLSNNKPLLWINPSLKELSPKSSSELSIVDILDAEERLNRFAPLLEILFPELESSKGIIESDLLASSSMLEQLNINSPKTIKGQLWIKADHELPVAGSIKARGGIYEVLCFAEELALKNNLLELDSDYKILVNNTVRKLFSQYTVLVSSTGNLGLSIGIMSAALGFKASVHMSIEAKEWKKERLRNNGVEVVEHVDDYSKAVEAGRFAAEKDPYSYFVDDENSKRLFLGYSVAALRLKRQLHDKKIIVDSKHPLFVYIPCGVGGAPGGITFGLKNVFGSHVHCFFVEPTQAPCMLLGMASNFEGDLSVYDIGLKVNTEADGLAVSKASELVGKIMKNLLSGIFTVKDEELFKFLYHLEKSESLKIEPSAAAGFAGPVSIFNTEQGKKYVHENNLDEKLCQSSHIVWTTGGCFVPETEYSKFWSKGKTLCSK